jgi:vesicle coat complex subunit
MKENKASNKQRVQFDFSPEALQRLEELKDKLDASTKAEVIRNALKLYEWFALQIDPSYIVQVEDKDGKIVYRIPAQTLLA